ncbi:polyprotein [Belem virus]|uniref:Envelopment polyprotein n=1 Tax=Belem virus TaxID=2748241 RepID=A0A7D9MW00_9VIRU|nr:polyprotein [Belem virus]QLA47090.1 polyprotein [Belem virus]
MLTLIVLLTLTNTALAVPLESRCFDEGIVVEERILGHGIAELCVKDDISIIKTTSLQNKNESMHTNLIMRKILIQNYDACNLIETKNGPIMIFKPNNDMMLVPHTYACRADCTISLDKEDASIILHSDKLNHYEVMGTTTATRWFQGTTSYSLEHTCEHIQVTCGQKILSFHACFKHHMSCIRTLNKSYMPAFMINSVCQNKELILMTLLAVAIFIFLYIISMTYICYILLIIFIPVAFVYGKIYDKTCKKCYYCGLSYHPFTKCGQTCVCGARFENSERMKKHRESGLCRGYKFMRTARVLCKNKGSNFILAILSAVFILSFVQPIEAVTVKYNNTEIQLESLSTELDVLINLIGSSRIAFIWMGIMNLIIMSIILFIYIFYKKIENRIYNHYIFVCRECDMVHPRQGLRFLGDFSNYCNSCMCGTQNYINDSGDDYVEPATHKLNHGCYAAGKYYATRKISNITLLAMISILVFLSMANTAYASADDCVNPANFRSKEAIDCSIWMTVSSCTPKSFTEVLARNILLPKDVAEIEKMDTNLNRLLEKTEKDSNLMSAFLLENAAAKMYCNEATKYDQDTGKYNQEFKKLLQNDLEICTTNKANKLCGCINSKSTCDQTDQGSDIVAYYKTNIPAFQGDMKKIVTSLSKVFPGIFAKELLLSLKNNTFTVLKNLIIKIKARFNHAKAIKSAITIVDKSLSDSTLEGKNPITPSLTRKFLPFDIFWKQTSIFENMEDSTAKKECTNYKLFRCTYPLSGRSEFFVTCNSENNKILRVPLTGFAIKQHEDTTLCAADSYCEADFEITTTGDKDKYKAMACVQMTINKNDYENSKSINYCKKLTVSNCKYKSVNTSFIRCANGLYYDYSDVLQQAPGKDVGVYCFTKECRTFKYGHHAVNLADCNKKTTGMQSHSLQKIEYDNIEQFKHSLEEKIKNDLIDHLYKPNANLPHIIPTFRPLSIQGVETDEGIQGSYIETNLLVKTGIAAGIELKDKSGNDVFDLILFVKSAHYEASGELIYTTGPTVGINLQHHEQCKGSCPSGISLPGWLSFSKEHTSQWGCEEFGCLAINEGCLWGRCQDVIKPEIDIIRRIGQEQPKITICITLPHETYCHEINSFNPIISDKMEIQFLSNEAGKIPKLTAYKSNKIYSGMINDLGTFSKMCGSVQLINNTVNGAGNVKFDYLCHAAKRKEVVVNRCFDNFYESCLKLEEQKNIVLDSQSKKLSLLNQNMGEIRIKIKLGDINYKTFEKNPSLDIKGSCAGCINCLSGIHCELNILSDSDVSCPITSNCALYYNDILIQNSITTYSIKAKCTTNMINLEICKVQTDIQITVVETHENIQVGNSDETYYVREVDNKCGTWLCKVADEGVSAIFSPFFSLFGGYAKAAIISVILIIFVILLVYILLPVFGRLRDILKKNEIEFKRESYGFKDQKTRN